MRCSVERVAAGARTRRVGVVDREALLLDAVDEVDLRTVEVGDAHPVHHDGVAVVVDRMSMPYLNGATIDFVDTIEKQGFTIDNPNAGGSCACGDSFH